MKKRGKDGKWKRTLKDKKCLVCEKIFKPTSSDNKFCSRECYYEMRRSGAYSKVEWTDEMREKMSNKYTGEGNPMYGKPSPLRGKKRPDFSGEKHPNYKGGWIQDGYKYICVSGKKYAEHRYIMEQHLGRELEPKEIVHHINYDSLDNRLENLQVVTRAEHIDIHREELNK